MKKRIWVLTMFDRYFDHFKEFGVLGSTFRGERGGSVDFELLPVSIPNYNKKGFKGVDSSPFGGGAGMIMRADSLRSALMEGVVAAGGYNPENLKEELHVVCPAPRGKTWSHECAVDFAQKHLSESETKDLVFICGRYEGIDERFLDLYVDEFISLGDYILTGGELAVMVILDSAMRFSSGVLGNKLSAVDESFANNKLEYALYTRPAEFEGVMVPSELRSGDHKKIEKFKVSSSAELTRKHRPDLLNE